MKIFNQTNISKFFNLKNILADIVYFLAFFLPWQSCYIAREVFLGGAKWEYGTVCLYLTDIILILLFGVFLANKIQKLKQNPSSAKLKKFFSSWNASQKIIIALIFWTFLSILKAPDRQLAFYFAVNLTAAIALFFTVQQTRFNIKKLIIIFIVSAVLQSSLGLFQFFSQNVSKSTLLGISAKSPQNLGVSVIQTSERRFLRAYGGLPHPNILGGYLSLTLLLAVYLYLMAEKKENPSLKDLLLRIFLLTSITIIFSGFIFSFSRNAWLAFGSGFLILLLNRFKSSRQGFLKIIFIFIALTLIMGLKYQEPFQERLWARNRLEKQSFQERADYTKESYYLIKKNFWTGVGAGNYTLAERLALGKDMPAWYFQPVHNVFLLSITEIGIIGGVLFWGMLILLFSLTKKFWIGAPLLILMLFDHWLWSSHFGLLLLFFILGVSEKLKD